MKKKKGFTLVELLAVIVILAVIAIITLPMMLNVIEKARQGSAKSSVYGYINALEKSVAIGALDSEKGIVLPTDRILETGSTDELIETIQIKGNKAKYLSAQFNEKLEIETGSFCIDKYSLDYEKEKGVSISKNDYCSNINIVILSETTTSSIKVTIKSSIENIKGYQYKLNDGEWSEIQENFYTFEGLKNDEKYEVYVKILALENYDYSKTISTKKLETAKLKSLTPSITGYLNQEQIEIQIVEGVNNYIKTTKIGTINIPVTESCGTGITPTNCSSITEVSTLEQNIWYKVDSDSIITYDQEIDSNETLYAISYDLTNYSTESTITLLKIDKTGPQITFESSEVTHNSATLKYGVSDNMSGAITYSCNYGIEEGTYDSKASSVKASECILTNLKADTTYYYEICSKDEVGNESCYSGNVKTNNGLIYLEEPISVYFDPETGENCSADEAISTVGTISGCMKWYAYSYNAITNEYNLLLDHDIVKGVAWGTKTTGPSTILNKIATLTSNWTGIDDRTDNYTSSTISGSTLTYTIDYTGYKARLITTKEICGIIKKSECQPTAKMDLTSEPWLYENRAASYYWTSDLYKNCNPWYINSSLQFDTSWVACNAQSDFGIRPVITLPKNKVEVS